MIYYTIVNDYNGPGRDYVVPVDKEQEFYAWLRSIMTYEDLLLGPPRWAVPVTGRLSFTGYKIGTDV